MDKKVFIWVFVTSLLIFFILIVIAFWHEESHTKIASTWEVKRISINSQDVTKDFKHLTFAPMAGGGITIILPYHKDKKIKKAFVRHEYEYYRTGFFEGNIRIFDKKQDIFSGEYQIEILNHNSPQWVRIYSDSIEFILLDQKISLGNPIKVDFGK